MQDPARSVCRPLGRSAGTARDLPAADRTDASLSAGAVFWPVSCVPRRLIGRCIWMNAVVRHNGNMTAKLTIDQANDIRQKHAGGLNFKQLSKMYGSQSDHRRTDRSGSQIPRRLQCLWRTPPRKCLGAWSNCAESGCNSIADFEVRVERQCIVNQRHAGTVPNGIRKSVVLNASRIPG